ARRPEEQRDEALQELVLRQLVDVLLEWKVDIAAGVADLRDALDGADVLAGHPRAQPRFDRRVLEVEEVTRIVPHEPVAHDGPAVATGLVGGLAHDHARIGMTLAPPVGEAEAAHARADD